MSTVFALFAWWFWVQLIGIAALPLAWRLFRALPDRGYTLSKPLGILLWGYALWLGATLGVLHNTLGGALGALALLAAVSYIAGREGLRAGEDARRPLFVWLRHHRRHVIFTEGLFVGAFLLWAYVRSRSPDIATAGGEKFMEIAFINGILTSRLFPPHDPWLAGYAISYYYFGYVMVAGLIRLAHVPSSVGFNVGFASWFALTVVAAYGVVGNLVAAGWGGRGEGKTHAREFSTRWGVIGALVLALMGNLEGVLEVLYARRLLPVAFWQWLDIRSINQPYDLSQPASWIPQRFIWWWQASRVIHDKDLVGNTMEVIDEFPAFSFILGDMHPHVLVLPFALLVIGLALSLFLSGRQPAGDDFPLVGRLPSAARAPLEILSPTLLVMYALALGGLAFLNTWDFPIYLALIMGVMLAVEARHGIPVFWEGGERAVITGIVLAVLGVLLYLPFYIGFQSQAGGILPNLFNPTRFPQFFVMFGPLLVMVVIFLVWLGKPEAWGTFGRWLVGVWLVPWAVIALLVTVFLFTPGGRQFLDQVFANPVVQQNVGGRSMGQLLAFIALRRLTNPWTFLILGVLLAWAITHLLGRFHPSEESPAHVARLSPNLPTFNLLLVTLGLLLTYAVEFVYIKDLFGTRMNTVFKFYFQAWVLWAVAGTSTLAFIVRQKVRWRTVALALSGVLVALGLVYTVLAVPARSTLAQAGPTLDGEAWVAKAFPEDYAVIRWVRANANDDDIVLEATGGSYSFFGRVSAFTGRPTLLGWDFHEWQWRGPEALQKQAGTRAADIERVYRQARGEELLGLLNQYGVDYLVVASQERQKYNVGPNREKEFDRTLEKVFEEGNARIYKVVK